MKFIITDFDGTLLNDEHVVSKENLNAIHKLKEMGYLFTIATGRPDQLMKEHMAILPIDLPIIMYNGAAIGHPLEEMRHYEETLSSEIAWELINSFTQRQLEYMIYTQHYIISKDHERAQFFKARNKSLPPKLKSNIVDVPITKDVILKERIIKVLLIHSDSEFLKEEKQRIEHTYGVSCVQSQAHFLDINAKGISKGEAVKRLAAYYQIDLKDVIVFGDQQNDVSMFLVAGTSVAMNNATEAVKAYATHVTRSNNEDGFAHFLNEHLFKI
jgi:Cof subfamily protein (haloacid dehalogenase superfamily)